MQYLVVHNTEQILLATLYTGDAVATNHTVLIDTFDNLVTQLELLNIDATPLVEAKQSHEQSLLNQSQEPIN